MIYLDHSASTPVLPQVQKKIMSIISIFGNPSSLHKEGQLANKVIIDAKKIISSKLNILSEEIYFTSGSTFSNNQAIQGFIQYNKAFRPHIITSSIEHDDIYLMLESYPKKLKHFVPCDENGELDINKLKEILEGIHNSPTLVSIQWANNEMGVIQKMDEISSIVHHYPNTFLHTDATQIFSYILPDLSSISIDMLSMSAQKIGGLKGTGLLYKKENIRLTPLVYGDQGLIGGTENVPGIACLGEAFNNLDYSEIDDLISKRNYLYDNLKEEGTLVGCLKNRLPNNINMIFDNVNGEELQALLSDMEIYVSTGSACSSHSDEPSHTLTAMGYSKEQAQSSIRFSLNNKITYDELDYVAKQVKFCLSILRNNNI